jgi:hypothetical protein
VSSPSGRLIVRWVTRSRSPSALAAASASSPPTPPDGSQIVAPFCRAASSSGVRTVSSASAPMLMRIMFRPALTMGSAYARTASWPAASSTTPGCAPISWATSVTMEPPARDTRSSVSGRRDRARTTARSYGIRFAASASRTRPPMAPVPIRPTVRVELVVLVMHGLLQDPAASAPQPLIRLVRRRARGR